MSENQNRGIRDFSKYNSMETSDLEQILRLDAEAPEGAESDTELLLYVMEVLASRRNNTNITGNTAQQAWESFQQNYLPHDVHNFNPRKERKPATPWVRRLIATAAVIALVIAIPLSVNAFSWKQLWNTVATWAKETFTFISSEDLDAHTPNGENEEEFTSLQDALAKSNRDPNLPPTWIPNGFILDKIDKIVTPVQEVYRATYRKDTNVLKVQIQSYLDCNPEKIEINEDLVEIYEVSGQDYYIFSNHEQNRAVWISDNYECYISGDLSIDELKQMIDSIEKG